MPDILPVVSLQSKGCTTVKYVDASNADVCIPQDIASVTQSGLSVSVSGDFGASGSVSLEGSADGLAFSPLNDYDGTAVAVTAAGTVFVREITRIIRPVVGGTSGDLTITIAVQH